MNKIFKFFKSFALVIALVLAFSACSSNGTVKAKLIESNEDQIAFTVSYTDKNATAFDALLQLCEQGKLEMEYQVSTYGAYVTSINGKSEQILASSLTSSEGYAWTLYTSDTECSYDYDTVTINGTVCGVSAYGASTLVLKEGEIYVWAYTYYNYSW